MSESQLQAVPLFACDSKKLYKEWYVDGKKQEFHAILSIVVEIKNNPEFNTLYNKTLDELFNEFSIERKRKVYNAMMIGTIFHGNEDRFKTFCLNFTRKILQSDLCCAYYVITRLNKRYLTNEKVIVYGEYACVIG